MTLNILFSCMTLWFSVTTSAWGANLRVGKEIQLIPSEKIRDTAGRDTKDLAMCLSMSLWNVRLLA